MDFVAMEVGRIMLVRRWAKTLPGTAAVLAVATRLLVGQSQPVPIATRVLTFEVASIRLDKSNSGAASVGFGAKGNRFTASNLPLIWLIRYAYNVNDDQVLNTPSWLNTEHYDIEAEFPEADADWLHKLSPEKQMLLLRPLLEDRFKLRVHHETKMTQVYELVVGKNGPKIKEAKLGDTYPNGIKAPDGTTGPGRFYLTVGQQDQLISQAFTMNRLAQILSKQLGIHVIDKTGLAGKYDLTLQWAPDESPGGGPSIFTAVQEQLGLRLESAKLPVDCLVIDHVERPSPN
jgi:uncharacterized protein (TIGR03435 family)